MAVSPQAAAEFIASADFVWHQKFELAPGVWTPGVSPIAWMCQKAGLPADLSGKTVLDIGTTNAATAFEAERRGAERVVAVDIFDPDWFGVRALSTLLESKVEYVQTSVYELAERFSEPFDLVIFWGVLYHLRHPLLALDSVRAVAGAEVSLETAVCDSELPGPPASSLVRFYRRDELSGDGSNWFAPSVATLQDWCASSGFNVMRSESWPDPAQRAMLELRPTPGVPEWQQVSYERPLRCCTRS